LKRIIYIIAGSVFLVIGLVGLALPVIPQVPFLLVVVLLLARGSEHVRHWIINSRLYKNYLKDRNIKWLKEIENMQTHCEP